MLLLSPSCRANCPAFERGADLSRVRKRSDPNLPNPRDEAAIHEAEAIPSGHRMA
jgi:hypothetical protein